MMFQRCLLVAALSLAAVCLPACGVDSDDSLPDDYGTGDGKGDIIGQDDLIPVAEDGSNIPQRYRSLLDAVGLIEFHVDGKRFHCTGTHIGDGVMLTAGHCFKDYGIGAETVGNVPLEPGTCVVHWGVRSSEGGYLDSDCTKLIGAKFDGDQFDGALVEVSPAPTPHVALAHARVGDGTRITIFSHPRGRALEWSQSCRVRQGAAAASFFHLCDTEPGSSGAAIIDHATLTIVGIHNAGLDDRNRASAIYEGLEF